MEKENISLKEDNLERDERYKYKRSKREKKALS